MIKMETNSTVISRLYGAGKGFCNLVGEGAGRNGSVLIRHIVPVRMLLPL